MKSEIAVSGGRRRTVRHRNFLRGEISPSTANFGSYISEIIDT